MEKLKKPIEAMEYILATDVGSTTTKARFFHKNDGTWRFLASGEAPTTVESPYEDVTLGVRNAVREVEELTGHRILSEDASGIAVPYDGRVGVDLYCTTSSAGGGLQMMVAGLMRMITAESANRAALGAGAIVMDIVARDDGRQNYEKIQRMRNLRPDMILLAGGTDGGETTHVLEIAELVVAAEPKPRLGVGYELPIVYAGNKNLSRKIEELMGKRFALSIVDNIRPTVDMEHAEPARDAIHLLFMEHVMSHAPGYTRLMKWTDVDIMPTPMGEGMAIRLIAHTYKMNVLGVGLGGATTNVYSIFDGKFVRSVSANLGMSYSVTNVMKEATIGNIDRWIPFRIDQQDIANRLMNKMIRPTTIPHTLEELIIEHSVAREALRLGLRHHKTIATRLKGIQKLRTISDILDSSPMEESYINMMEIDIIAGTGGLLSHAPRRVQSMLILIDAFQPEGVTRMFQDSVFMMPHLGVLSTVHRDAAWSIFEKDCLVRLGTVIAPAGIGKPGEQVMTVMFEMPDGQVKEELKLGDVKRVELPERKEVNVTITPQRGFDMGRGGGNEVKHSIMGGVVGVILDARGRPLQLPEEEKSRKQILLRWFQSLHVYPEDSLRELV